MTRDEEMRLTIAMYKGEHNGDLAALTYICDIEGSALPYDRPPISMPEAKR